MTDKELTADQNHLLSMFDQLANENIILMLQLDKFMLTDMQRICKNYVVMGLITLGFFIAYIAVNIAVSGGIESPVFTGLISAMYLYMTYDSYSRRKKAMIFIGELKTSIADKEKALNKNENTGS